MKTQLQPIALQAKSNTVILLHQVLAALGYTVTSDEVTKGKAGKDTLKKVRALQKQLTIVPDETHLIDENTIEAVIKTMNDRGLMASKRSFTVKGQVRLDNGVPKERKRLLAVDLDLEGVAVFRTVKKITEIKKNNGLEYLGETTSDYEGNYRLTFYDWQYRRA